MVTDVLRFVTSHSIASVAIPGAKLPAQATMNAAAGKRILTKDELRKLVSLME